jgi:hypothetical protein
MEEPFTHVPEIPYGDERNIDDPHMVGEYGDRLP